jgi:uncharacterized protein (DUF849 family)
MNSGIMVAPNGARLTYNDHPNVPLKDQEIIQTAFECEKAGAQAIHLHIRDNKLKHVLDAKRYEEVIKGIKKSCTNDFIIQATTEAIGIYKPSALINLIKELKPQAASIALKELIPSNDNIQEIKEAKNLYKFAREENIGIQHILYSEKDLKQFYKYLEQDIIIGDKHSVLFVLGRYSKNQNCDSKDLIPYLQTLNELNLEKNLNWMTCAFGKEEIPSLVSSAILGGNCRVGFENSRILPTNKLSKSNSSQIQYLKNIFNKLNINQVPTEKMREVLGIFK